VRIVVAGWVAGFPVAGFFWHAVSYALGFRALGHDVWFLDDAGDEPWGWDPENEVEDPACAAGVRFLAREMDAVGMGDRWMFRHAPLGRWEGTGEATAREVLASADLFVNVSLVCPLRPEYLAIPQRAGIDTDPVFTQVRIARGDALLARVPEVHTRLFTFGRPPLPAQQGEWVPTRQAVALEHWPVAGPAPDGAPFTTLTTWKAYPPVTWDGVEYGAKDRSLREFLDLPRHTGAALEVAMGAGDDHQQGAAELRAHGWRLSDPVAASISSAAYRDWIAAGAGEVGFAKHGYVAARSGWFSERTCCYLASGRPAVVQDTGWSDWLPTGEGLFAFSTVAEAAAGLDAVRADPARHAAAARRIAEEHFDAAVVCDELLEAL
jgi:hypothetical protein